VDDKDLLLQILNAQRDSTKVFHVGITDLGRMVNSFSGSLRNIAATDDGGFATLVNFMQQIRPEQSLKSLGQAIQVISKGIFTFTNRNISEESGSFQLVNSLYDAGAAITKAATGGFNYKEGAKGEHNDLRERVNFILDEDIGPYRKPRPSKPEKAPRPESPPRPERTPRTTEETPSSTPRRSGSRASGDNPRARGTNPRATGNNPRASSPFAGLEGLNIAALQVTNLNVANLNVPTDSTTSPVADTTNSYLGTPTPPNPINTTTNYLGGNSPVVPQTPGIPKLNLMQNPVASMPGLTQVTSNLANNPVVNTSTTSTTNPTTSTSSSPSTSSSSSVSSPVSSTSSSSSTSSTSSSAVTNVARPSISNVPLNIPTPTIPLPPMPPMPGGGLAKLLGPISSVVTGLGGFGGKLLSVATGPVGAIAMGLTSAFTAVWGFATTLKNAGAAILDSYKGLAEVSGNFASLFAVRDVHKITMDMQRGASIGDSANALNQSQMGLEKAMAPISNFLDKLTNYSMALLIDLMTTIINLFLSPIETIKNIFIGFINMSLEMGAMIYEAIAWVVGWISKDGGDMVKSMAETARQMKIANEPKDTKSSTDLAADLGKYQAGMRARFAQ